MLHVTRKFQNPATGRSSAPLRKLLAAVAVLGALFTSQQAVAQSASIDNDAVTLTVQPTGQPTQTGQNYAGSQNDAPYDTYTGLGQSNGTGPTAPQLGTYDLNGNSALTLTAASMNGTITTSNTNVSSTRLQYRVYLMGTADTQKPSYTNLTLTSTQNQINSSISTFTGSASGANVNLLSGLVNGGMYVLDVRFQLDITRNSTIRTVTDLSGGDYFYANFYVTPPPVTPPGGTTTWQGVARGTTTDPNGNPIPITLSSDTEWFNTANWTNGVPTRLSNAIIPAKTTSPSIVYPILNDPNAVYEVNNLTLQGNSGSSAAQVVINAATLRVYGNLNQPAGGLAGNTIGSGSSSVGVTNPQTNSTIIFAGADQIITGQLVVSDIIIAGSGTKSVINTLVPSNILAFQPTSASAGVVLQSAAQDVTSGTVTTVFDTTGNSYIQLVSGAVISTVAGQAETNTSYIKGVTRVDRTLTSGVTNTFGNVGLDITANHTPGLIFVYRVVGDPLTGPVSMNSTPAVPVKRYFKIVGDDNSEAAATASSTIDIVFHYLDSTNELNGIQENNLTLFRSKVNGAPYSALFGTLNTAANTVTRTTIPSLTTSFITLGDRTNPLPVSLVAFAAVRAANNAVLTWTTATEENNKGFNVQVSTDGQEFHTLAFVVSQLTNSTQALNYKYTDLTEGKAGVRYYRLEQVDLSGKTSYSPVRAISFDGGVAQEITLAAYPNPFNDALGLTVSGTTVTDGTAQVKVVDMTGREVFSQKLALTGASLNIGDLSGLRSGLYLAKVTLPDGSTKAVRIQKQ